MFLLFHFLSGENDFVSTYQPFETAIPVESHLNQILAGADLGFASCHPAFSPITKAVDVCRRQRWHKWLEGILLASTMSVTLYRLVASMMMTTMMTEKASPARVAMMRVRENRTPSAVGIPTTK